MNSNQQILQKYWGFHQFRPMQEEVVNAVLEGKDTLALLPTGGGKSICFQVPALAKEGICIVISPLIALMQDQVQNLKKKGIKAIAIYTGQSKREIDTALDNCIFDKEIKFLYISPERINTEIFLSRIVKMNVNLIAVDEAHCISQWGYDFRPAYLKIALLRELLPHTPIIALTATATPAVQIDIQEKLLFKEKNCLKKSFYRENLAYILRKAEHKSTALLGILQKMNSAGIVYVRNRKQTKEIADFLTKNKIKSDFYHAGLLPNQRTQKQMDWLNNKTKIIVCTNAFGMGIDKPDVRIVLHTQPCESLEAYFQEAGRAGRDEQKAYAVILSNQHDIAQLREKINSFPSLEDIKNCYKNLMQFLQIPYGSGENMEYDFDLSLFAIRYKYNPNFVLQIFQLLASQEVLHFSEGISEMPKIAVACSKETLYKFQVENRKYEPIVKFFLRNCSGIFEQDVTFNEQLIASKTNIKPEQLRDILIYLDSIHIFRFTPRKDKPILTFFHNRNTDDSLFLDPNYIEQRRNNFIEKITAVKDYYENITVCRSLVLLRYFGEKADQECRKCDICLTKKKTALDNQSFELHTKKIEEILKKSNLRVNELSDQLQLDIEKTIEICNWLTELDIISRSPEGTLFWRKSDI